MKYLHLSVFDSHVRRHGGTRRSEQLRELLESLDGTKGVTVNPYLATKPALRIALRHPLMLLAAFASAANLYMTWGLSFFGFLQYAICSVNLRLILKRHDFDLVLHETAPGISITFMHYLATRGINFVAIPHNVEHLVPGQVMRAYTSNHRVYQAEIEGYRAARRVLTMHDFDTAILRRSGVDAYTLEYRTIQCDRERFERIRKARAGRSSFEGFLLIGTVGNRPTFSGIKMLLETLITDQSKISLTVAGYGTEVFSGYESDTVRVCGSLTDIEMDSLLCETSAVLINQPQTSGFLTKIVEMNECGIPQIITSGYLAAEGIERFGVYKIKIESLQNFKIPAFFEFFPDLRKNNPLTEILYQCKN